MQVLFVSLGCDKNLVDSEHMLGQLLERGCTLTDDEEQAEIIIINTCCFILDAKEESVENILQMAEYRKKGSCRALIVTGCMAERYRQEILDEIPEVDAVLGTNSLDRIGEVLDKALAGQKSVTMSELKGLPALQGRRLVTTGGHYEYLKIAEGCDKHCTYCIIPHLRGSYRSVPMEELLQEAETMVKDGVRELILVAQETTVYGVDLYGEKSLHILLKKLCQIGELHWIRILYCYPEEIYPEMVQVMREEPKICHYLDLPIQHANDEILRRMGRRTGKQQLIDTVRMLREAMPDIVLRTTLISGFPGETKAQHEELMAFVDEMEFERLGVFPYSAEEGTPAAVMPDQVPEETKQRRRDEILSLQQEISADLGQSLIGTVQEVQIEGFVPDENAYVGRTCGDAPGVDGYCFVQTARQLESGDFVQVHITGALEYDLIGELEDEFTE